MPFAFTRSILTAGGSASYTFESNSQFAASSKYTNTSTTVHIDSDVSGSFSVGQAIQAPNGDVAVISAVNYGEGTRTTLGTTYSHFLKRVQSAIATPYRSGQTGGFFIRYNNRSLFTSNQLQVGDYLSAGTSFSQARQVQHHGHSINSNHQVTEMQGKRMRWSNSTGSSATKQYIPSKNGHQGAVSSQSTSAQGVTTVNLRNNSAQSVLRDEYLDKINGIDIPNDFVQGNDRGYGGFPHTNYSSSGIGTFEDSISGTATQYANRTFKLVTMISNETGSTAPLYASANVDPSDFWGNQGSPNYTQWWRSTDVCYFVEWNEHRNISAYGGSFQNRTWYRWRPRTVLTVDANGDSFNQGDAILRSES